MFYLLARRTTAWEAGWLLVFCQILNGEPTRIIVRNDRIIDRHHNTGSRIAMEF
jgi:hypothetical protein